MFKTRFIGFRRSEEDAIGLWEAGIEFNTYIGLYEDKLHWQCCAASFVKKECHSVYLLIVTWYHNRYDMEFDRK